MDKYLKYFSDNENLILSYLDKFVSMETPSGDKKLTDKTANWLKDEFIKLTGGAAKIIENDNYGNNILAEYGGGDCQILILAHYDTVWPKETISKRPFAIDENKAFGPGVFDMKAGLILGIFAIKAIKDLNVDLNKKVVFLFDSDEEIGNPSSRDIIEKEAVKSERAFVLEPAKSLKGSLKTSRKGTAEFKLKIKGKPAHSGLDPEKGVSAIDELSKQIQYLHNLNDLNNGISVNVGVVSGGTRVNVTAEYAEALIDVRAKTAGELEKLTEKVLNIRPFKDGISLNINGGINRMPLEYSRNIEEMYETAFNLAKENLGIKLTKESTGGGSDGNITGNIIPTLDGLGAVGDGAHANHEYILLDETKNRGALFANLIEYYGSID